MTQEQPKEIPISQNSFSIKTKDTELSKFQSEGVQNTVDLETLVKLTVVRKREEIKLLAERWSQLNSLLSNPNEGPYASALLDSKPTLLTENNLVLICDFDQNAKKINVQENQTGLRKLIKKILGRQVAIYALNREQFSDLQQRYKSYTEFGKLPQKEEIEDIKIV